MNLSISKSGRVCAQLALVGVGMLISAGVLAATHTYDIAAKAYNKSMPDGSQVPMWGYVLDTNNCYTTSPAAARLACVNGLLDPTGPGPVLSVPAGNHNVFIRLSNGLPEPTSIVIVGQEMPDSVGNNQDATANDEGPTWQGGAVGSRPDPTARVRSFGREATGNGGRRIYRWRGTGANGNRLSGPGTFLYHSGTYPQKQVLMGLYGAITRNAVDAAPDVVAEAYAGVPYLQEEVLFYSEIDPVLNASISASAGTNNHPTSIDYHPTWFLINGEPYTPNTPDIHLTAGNNTLLRFLSAAGETHVSVLQGQYVDIHAEDGAPYTFQENGGADETRAPRTQHTVHLSALKTKDAILKPVAGRTALYDGNGYMTNPTDPENTSEEDSVGGMLRFFDVAVSTNLPPVAAADVVHLNEMGRYVAPAPGVLANDTDPDLDPLIAVQDSGLSLSRGTLFGLGSDGSVDYRYNGGIVGLLNSFTYHATDAALDSNVVLIELVRELSVTSATCAGGATCDWSISGRVMPGVPNGTQIEAWLGDFDTGVLIGATAKVAVQWNISVSGSTAVPAGQQVNVRVAGFPNAFIRDFSPTVTP